MQTDNIKVEPNGFKSHAEMYSFFLSKIKTATRPVFIFIEQEDKNFIA